MFSDNLFSWLASCDEISLDVFTLSPVVPLSMAGFVDACIESMFKPAGVLTVERQFTVSPDVISPSQTATAPGADPDVVVWCFSSSGLRKDI